MRKDNVFLVTCRSAEQAGPAPDPVGIQQLVLCAADVGALFDFARSAFPHLVVVGAVSLTSLEETSRQVKEALAGSYRALPVYVDPALAR